MLNCDIVKVTRDARCRGHNPKCQCIGQAGIKKGSECLRVKISNIGNNSTSFYCKVCMFDVIEKFRKLIHFIDTGNKI